MTWRATLGISTVASEAKRAAIKTIPVDTAHSAMSAEYGSCWRKRSRIASLIWSHNLSGCPSVTDSEVNMKSFCIPVHFIIIKKLGLTRQSHHDCQERGLTSFLCATLV